MGFLQTLKNTFLPDEQTSKERRLRVFGTESKKVAGAVIVGAAAAAIAAPVLITAAGGRQAVLSGLGRTVAANPVKSAVVGIVGAPLVAGSVVRDPTIVTKAPVQVGQYSKDLYDLAKDPSIDNAKELIKNSPLLTTATAVALVGAGVVGTATAIGNAIDDNDVTVLGNGGTPNTGAGGLPAIGSPAPPAVPTTQPLTRETQVLGKEVKSGSVARRRAKRRKEAPSTTTRIQILNQNTYIGEAT